MLLCVAQPGREIRSVEEGVHEGVGSRREARREAV